VAIDRAIVRPSLCKIDVQGAELMVLDGMTRRLGDTDALVVETGTIATVQGGAEAAAVGQARPPVVPNKAAPGGDRRWAATA